MLFPLSDIKPKLVQLNLCMSYTKRSLTVSEGLRLPNNLIKDILAQEKLIAWKMARKIYQEKEEELGTVGFSYWKAFLKCHKHLLKSKTASPYTIDRSNFTITTSLRYISI